MLIDGNVTGWDAGPNPHSYDMYIILNAFAGIRGKNEDIELDHYDNLIQHIEDNQRIMT